jgi:ABC-type arginine transport system permease subunit
MVLSKYLRDDLIFNEILSFITISVIIKTHDHPKNETPHKYYVIVAAFYLLAMVTSNYALYFVDYVVQVVGKCE